MTCDLRDREDRYVKRYPKLIVEVLSSSTEIFDSGEKFEDYKKLDSLEKYVLISQDSQRVECRRRTATNTWETDIYEMGDRLYPHQIVIPGRDRRPLLTLVSRSRIFKAPKVVSIKEYPGNRRAPSYP